MNRAGVDSALLAEIRHSAHDFLQRRNQKQRKRMAVPIDRGYWREIAGIGWLGMCVPETRGGLGLGWHAMAVVLEEAGRAQLSETLVAAAVLPTVVLVQPRDEVGAAERQRLLQDICAGSRIVGLAWQRIDGQLHVHEATDCAVSAAVRGDGYVLHGEIRHVIPGDGVDGWLGWWGNNALLRVRRYGWPCYDG